ncbi:MAG TPA: hypothetical protein VGC61_08630, partial [Pyrinomonadaceae bacterium]
MRVEEIKGPLVSASVVRAHSRAPQWIIPAIKTALVVTDSLIAALSFVVAYALREDGSIFDQTRLGSFTWSARFAPYGALLIFVVVIRVLALRYYDLYRLRGEFSFFEDGLRVFKSTAIGS